ncbi:MAG TPA: DUF1802 family protein [Methylomirabilota bacterium]|jgi:hypothetical protein
MLALNRVALKEWAVVCHGLAAGHQVALLRKGGIREPAGGFEVEHREFFLLPTYFHEKAEELTAAVRTTLPDVARTAPPGGILRFDLYATVEAAVHVAQLERLRDLDGQHALAWPAVERRFHYRRPGLHVIAVRAWRLPRPVETPALFRYDGCRSWVTLEEELPVDGARPVLDDRSFQRRMAVVHDALRLDPSMPGDRRPA